MITKGMTREQYLEHILGQIKKYFENRITELDSLDKDIKNLSSSIECRENYINILHIIIHGIPKEKNI